MALLERETLDSEEILAVMEGSPLPERQRIVIPIKNGEGGFVADTRTLSGVGPRIGKLIAGDDPVRLFLVVLRDPASASPLAPLLKIGAPRAPATAEGSGPHASMYDA